MSKHFTEEEINIAHALRVTIETAFQNYESGSHFSYQTIGAGLAQMRDGKMYKELGYKTMDEVIKDMGKSRSICYSMMDYNDVIVPALEHYPDLRKMSVTDLCKFVIPYIRGCATSGIDWDKIVEICNLPASDQDDELGRLRGKTVKIDCAHEVTESWVRCSVCNKFIKVV